MRFLPWLIVLALVMSAVSYVTFLMGGAKWAALGGLGGLGAAVVFAVVLVAGKVGK